MIDRLRRAWCRYRHQGLHLDAVPIGRRRPGLRCRKCGAGFASLADAGRLRLSAYERVVSEREREQVERLAIARERFDGTSYRLVRGGRLVGDYADAAHRRVVGGETLKVVRLRPGGAR